MGAPGAGVLILLALEKAPCEPMKTSFVAVVAATLFLVAALFGIGSGNGTPPSQPGTILLTGSGAARGPGAAVPLIIPTPGGSSRQATSGAAAGGGSGGAAVEAVGRSVQQANLLQLLNPSSSGTNSGAGGAGSTGPVMEALSGITPVPESTITTQPIVQNPTPSATGGKTSPTITTSPITGTQPVPSPTGNGLKGILGGVGGLLGLGPTPTPSPKTPTSTATPTVTSTATGG